ncbi:hypothetical protein GCM10011445_23630 [Pseudocitrobacter faecalis]|nr:hypothetical protein GCM10011445_23630 [Pseudocitrobacter faecalis]
MPEAQFFIRKFLTIETAKYGDDITLNKPLLLYALSQNKKGMVADLIMPVR